MSTTSATPSASPSPPRKTAWLAFLLVLLAAMATHLGKATRTETPIYRPPFNPTLIRSHRLTPTADPTGSPLLLDIAYTRTSFRRFPPSFHGAGAGGRGYSPALVSPPPPPLRPRTDSSCIDPDPSSHRQGGGGLHAVPLPASRQPISPGRALHMAHDGDCDHRRPTAAETGVLPTPTLRNHFPRTSPPAQRCPQHRPPW